MKLKIFLLSVLAAMLTLTLVACTPRESVTYYTVKFDTNGADAIQDRVIEDGKKVTEPDAPSKSGYSFVGWFLGEEEWDFDTNTVSSDITLKAKFERNVHTVTFKNGNDEKTLTVNSGDKLDTPASPTKENYDFLGWISDNAYWNFDNPVISDLVLSAAWQEKAIFLVRFDSAGGNSISPQSVYDGQALTAPTSPTKQGHDFEGWYLDGNKWDFAKNKVTDNIVLVAKWTPYPTYTVSFESDGGTFVFPQYVKKNGLIAEPKNSTKEGHKLTSWYYNGTPWDFSTPVTENMTLYAQWDAAQTCKFTFDSTAIDAIDPVYIVFDQDFVKGEKTYAPDMPNISPSEHGYRFLGWYVGDVKWDFENNVATSDTTLTAKIVKSHKVTISLGSVPNGGAEFEKTVYYIDDGEKIQVPATPTYPLTEYASMWSFDGWFVSYNKKWDFSSPVTKDTVIYAEWVIVLPPQGFN